MALLQGKQINIDSVVTAIENYFQNNETALEQFIDIISGGEGLNNKVQTSSNDPNPSDFLIEKVGADNTDPSISLTIALSNDKSKVNFTATLDYEYLFDLLLANIEKIYFVATGTQSIYVDTTKLLNSYILIITREGNEIYEGDEEDEYHYDPDAATITFNTPLESGERVKILVCGQSDLDLSDITTLRQEVTDALAAISAPIVNNYTGNSSYIIPDNKLLEKVVVIPSANTTAFSIGTTNGGTDILPALPINANNAAVEVLNLYGVSTTTIWFNGITSATQITIYLR